MSFFKVIIGITIRYIIPISLIWFGKQEQYFQSNLAILANIEMSGIIWAYIVAVGHLEWKNKKNLKFSKALDHSLKHLNDYVSFMIKSYFETDKAEIKINFYGLPRSRFTKLNRLFSKNKKLSLIEIPGIDIDHDNTVTEYVVSKTDNNKCEGLVGLCYFKNYNKRKGVIVKDMNMSDNIDSEDYNMNNFQISTTNWIKFAICLPIQNNKGKLKYVLSIETDITPRNGEINTEFQKILSTYGIQLHRILNVLKL